MFNLLIIAGKKIKKKKEYNKMKTLVLLALWCPHYEYVRVIYTHTHTLMLINDLQINKEDLIKWDWPTGDRSLSMTDI